MLFSFNNDFKTNYAITVFIYGLLHLLDISKLLLFGRKGIYLSKILFDRVNGIDTSSRLLIKEIIVN